MPNHIDQRIAFLRKLINDGLHQANLDQVVAECSALAQDTSHVLAFFVLKQIFVEVSSVLDGEAVTLDRFRELTSELTGHSMRILDKIANNERIEAADLEHMVCAHVRNVNVFRSER